MAYVLVVLLVLGSLFRFIAVSLRKGAESYEYTRNEYKKYDDYAFHGRK